MNSTIQQLQHQQNQQSHQHYNNNFSNETTFQSHQDIHNLETGSTMTLPLHYGHLSHQNLSETPVIPYGDSLHEGQYFSATAATVYHQIPQTIQFSDLRNSPSNGINIGIETTCNQQSNIILMPTTTIDYQEVVIDNSTPPSVASAYSSDIMHQTDIDHQQSQQHEKLSKTTGKSRKSSINCYDNFN